MLVDKIQSKFDIKNVLFDIRKQLNAVKRDLDIVKSHTDGRISEKLQSDIEIIQTINDYLAYLVKEGRVYES